MKLSRNLWIFIALNSVSTVLFVICMKFGILFERTETADTITLTSWLPVAYGTVWAISGLILGINDKVRNSRHNLELRYGIATALITLGGLIILGLVMPEMGIRPFVSLLIMFGVIFSTVLGIQWIMSRRTIKGMKKKDLFK